jgi:F-box domain
MAMPAEIPDELWLMVFEHLTYETLKTCESVSKTFNAFTKSPSLDPKLFRGPVQSSNIPVNPEKVELHPAFEAMSNGMFFCFMKGPCPPMIEKSCSSPTKSRGCGLFRP